MDSAHFNALCQQYRQERDHANGIGTLREKTLHAIIKRYLCQDTSCHEVKVGRYIVDILVSPQSALERSHVVEIQTRNLRALQKKLPALLVSHKVTVVHPIIQTKHLGWVNSATGECSKPRKSPKKGTFADVFFELYFLKDFIAHPHFTLHLLLYDGIEWRLQNPRTNQKRGSTRIERIPTGLVDEKVLQDGIDYHGLLPCGLPSPFVSKDFCKACHISSRSGYAGLKILTELGVIKKVGKQRNAYLYEINHQHSS